MLANRVRMSQIKKGIPIPSYVLAQDSDFSGSYNGSFRYIGSHEYVIIPHVIKGVNVTAYDQMFTGTSTTLKGVASDNLNVTSMWRMFYNNQATTLDLSNFDTSSVTNMTNMFSFSQATTLDLSSFNISKVTNMNNMFEGSKATTGYARTQTEANRFNSSITKRPAGLTFVVKP